MKYEGVLTLIRRPAQIASLVAMFSSLALLFILLCYHLSSSVWTLVLRRDHGRWLHPLLVWSLWWLPCPRSCCSCVANSNDNWGNTGQQAYYETKDSSLLGCHFPGLCLYSNWGEWSHCEGGILRHARVCGWSVPQVRYTSSLGGFQCIDWNWYGWLCDVCWSTWVWNCEPE